MGRCLPALVAGATNLLRNVRGGASLGSETVDTAHTPIPLTCQWCGRDRRAPPERGFRLLPQIASRPYSVRTPAGVIKDRSVHRGASSRGVARVLGMRHLRA